MKKLGMLAGIAVLATSLLTACGTTQQTDNSQPTATTPDTATQTDTATTSDYVKYKDQIDTVTQAIAKYQDINAAIKDGFVPGSGFVPMMGYHFINPKVTDFKVDQPSTLLYVLDGNTYKLVGAEWNTVNPNEKSPFPEAPFRLTHEASSHYDDGTELPCKDPKQAFQTNPKTGGKFVTWHPDIYGIHVYTGIQNPDGPFVESNPALTKYSDDPILPPLDATHGITMDSINAMKAAAAAQAQAAQTPAGAAAAAGK